jgi:hypothetical protein
MLGAAHPQHPRVQIRLVLEEVHVAPSLVLGVMHRALVLTASLDRARETGAAWKVQVQIQPARRRVELGPRHRPRLLQPQRQPEQIGVLHRAVPSHKVITDGHDNMESEGRSVGRQSTKSTRSS